MNTIEWAALVGVAVVALAAGLWFWRRHAAREYWLIPYLLHRHFAPASAAELLVSERRFPLHIRADLQRTLDGLLRDMRVQRFVGVHKESAFFGLDFSELATNDGSPAWATAPQFEDLDIGEEQPVRCLKTALWLLRRDNRPYALFMAQAMEPCGVGFLRIQTAAWNDAIGEGVIREIQQHFEQAVASANCYRGKVLSFEHQESYRGQSSGITVHRLRTVERDQVVLPPGTLELLDRNVLDFARQRPRLRELGLPTKKGVLFYGPPGTGKTHTVHYLAKALPDHTTLLIAAEQVQYISHYLTMARLLQPSLVVIEDVDLIARDRTDMRNPWEETLLNKLLNEMDGLREDADIFFILTTNRPESLEAALASRPGRIDQAIEFALPDDAARRRLAVQYAQGTPISEDLVREIAARTDRVSAAFIRELMRRAIQFHLSADRQGELQLRDVELALDEMLHAGGSLNLKLLGTAIGQAGC